MRKVAILIVILFALVAFFNAYSVARAHANPHPPMEKSLPM
ncbi:MAG: hypothetical protein N2442_00830 [Spirochaetes bacterium]|nr:hypothetical protein [Spirochaetota bacterium]